MSDNNGIGEDFIKFTAAIRDALDGFDVPKELYSIDPYKKRVEIAAWVLEEVHEELPGISAIVEEYPSADRLEVERAAAEQHVNLAKSRWSERGIRVAAAAASSS